MMQDKVGQNLYIKDSSIHDCFQRCLVIHNSNGITVSNNVAFNTYGHCFFLEDGPEMFNVFDHNLAVRTTAVAATNPNQIFLSDKDVCSISFRFFSFLFLIQ